jgi:hypothetical protein
MVEGFVNGYIDGKVGTCVLLLFSWKCCRAQKVFA